MVAYARQHLLQKAVEYKLSFNHVKHFKEEKDQEKDYEEIGVKNEQEKGQERQNVE